MSTVPSFSFCSSSLSPPSWLEPLLPHAQAVPSLVVLPALARLLHAQDHDAFHLHLIEALTRLGGKAAAGGTKAQGQKMNLHRASEPGNVLLEVGEGNLPKQSVVVVSQISSVEKARQNIRARGVDDGARATGVGIAEEGLDVLLPLDLAGECLRRQLFDEQFDQQVGIGHHAASTSLSATIFAVAASAQALGAIGKPSRMRLSR